jgi:hypothetical protein
MKTFNKTQNLKNRLKLASVIIVLLTPMYMVKECAAQAKKKTFEIIRTPQGVFVGGTIHYTENDPTDTVYYMFGEDARYPSLHDLFTISSGKLETIEALLNNCSEALKEDGGVSLEYGDNKLNVIQAGKAKVVAVRNDGSGDAYTTLNKAQIDKISKGISTYKNK